MIVLKRTHFGDQLHPSEEIEIVGSTGNVYTVSSVYRLPLPRSPRPIIPHLI